MKAGFFVNTDNSLSSHPLFSLLDEDAFQEIESIMQVQRFKSGEWIVHHGDIWPYLFFVQEGEAIAIKESSEGRSLTLTTIRQGEIF